MQLHEVKPGLNAGKKIRRRVWNDESYMQLVDGRLIIFIGGNATLCEIARCEESAFDWQILGDEAAP